MIPIIQEIAADGQVKTNPWKTTVILLAIAVSVFAWLYFVQRGESTSATTSGTTSGAVSGAIGTIKLPNGQTVNVKYDGPPELKATLEQGTARETVAGIKDSYQVRTTTTLTNVSSGDVSYSSIQFLLGASDAGFERGKTLGPKEKVTLIKDFSVSGAATITVQVKGFQKTAGSSIQPVPTTPVAKSGSWSQTFQTVNGPIVVNYTETSSAKNKLNVSVKQRDPAEGPQGIRLYIQNSPTGSFVIFTYYLELREAGGKMFYQEERERELNPGQTYDFGSVGSENDTTVRTVIFKVEVK